jgi:hypothetical protein
MTVYRCEKHRYGTYREAIRAMRGIRAKYMAKARPREQMPIRAYHCDPCGSWHLTSMPLARTGDHDTHRKAA